MSEDTSYIRFIGARIKREAEINNFRWGKSLLRKMKNPVITKYSNSNSKLIPIHYLYIYIYSNF